MCVCVYVKGIGLGWGNELLVITLVDGNSLTRI